MIWSRLSILSIGAALVLALTSAPPGFPQAASAPPASGAQLKLTVTITDARGRYVTPLSKDRITVLDEKVPAEVTSFGPSDEPMSVGLLLDLSREDRAALLASTKAAFTNFVNASGHDHRYFVAGFDGETHLAADWAGTAAEVAAGFDRLWALRPSGRAALYDALSAALAKVAAGPHAKRVVILISDGRNEGSKLKREELFEAVRRSDALIYAAGVKPPGANLFERADLGTLERLCSLSGGVADEPRSRADFYAFFERLVVELKNQYSVGFNLPGAGRGGWRRLGFKAKRLEVKKPSSKDVESLQLFVRGREGYYYKH